VMVSDFSTQSKTSWRDRDASGAGMVFVPVATRSTARGPNGSLSPCLSSSAQAKGDGPPTLYPSSLVPLCTTRGFGIEGIA
jgi:hypothetical protein